MPCANGLPNGLGRDPAVISHKHQDSIVQWLQVPFPEADVLDSPLESVHTSSVTLNMKYYPSVLWSMK